MRAGIIAAAVGWLATATLAADTLVLCPSALEPALADWTTLREEQGHQVTVVAPASTYSANRDLVREAFKEGGLRFVVLVGDVALPGAAPCGYEPLQVIRRWGPEKIAATDNGYADTEGDAAPDLAVGRIPCTSPSELRAYLRRVIEHETRSGVDWRDAELSVVASPGNFSPLLDRVIEAAATRVLSEATPAAVGLNVVYASPGSPWYPGRDRLHEAVTKGLGRSSLAWVYLGHGLPYQLDVAPWQGGVRPLLDTQTVLRNEGRAAPVAAMLACYTGAMDARDPCLAEALLASPRGPLAVIAASRVTMPYGNARLGLALLEGLFSQRESLADTPTIGEILWQAKKDALAGRSSTRIGAALDQIAVGFAGGTDQERERLEHVQVYNLMGDPLLSLRTPLPIDVAAGFVGDNQVEVELRTPIAGQAEWCLALQERRRESNGRRWRLIGSVPKGDYVAVLRLFEPVDERGGKLLVRIRGEDIVALGSATLERQPERATVASKPDVSDRR